MIKLGENQIIPEYYPDGTLRLNVNEHSSVIHWDFENNEEQLILYYLVKHIRNEDMDRKIDLIMHYVPNARMDRVKTPYEVFTLKWFCEFINDLKFNKVYVSDVHSNCSLIAINRIKQMRNNNVEKLIKKLSPTVLFYPDEGAMKRYSEEIKYPYLFGIKKRDWETGKILGLDVHGDIPKDSFDVLIFDDISSYGGTFLYSAKKLKELGADKIYLYITHCENSILDGELIKSGLIEKIYTTKSIFTKQHELIEIIGG